jgi:crossover junction endodeoxyribonuclease RusA
MTTTKPPELVLEFQAPTQPMSENAARGLHWAKARKALKPWHDAAWAATRNQITRGRVPWLGHRAVTIQASIPFTTHRRRDPHNYVGTVVKAMVDGVVRAGLVPDDTPEWVEVLEPILVVGSPRIRKPVTVTIMETNHTT